MIFPQSIKPGDKIGIVSTASRIDVDVVLPAVKLLESLGYQVEIAAHALSQYHQFAATDEERASDLQSMLDRPEIKTIICSRGGYGTLRTLELIDWNKFIEHPKWIVGFSDITVLHSKLNLLGISSIHGVMPRYFLDDDNPSLSFNYLLDSLVGKSTEYQLTTNNLNRIGKATGELVGGNLSMLYSLRGTSYDIDTTGKILFIEDLDEYLYHLDRMMMNLKVGNKLSKLAGLIIGSFTAMKDNDTPFGKSVEEIIFDSVKEYDFPVAFNFPVGHTKQNYALKMGSKVTLSIDKSTTILNQS
jgi:muramoyltetrapeptide carboxypeptidase